MKGIIVANRYRDTYLVGNTIDLILKVGDKVVIKTPEGYDLGVVTIMDIELLNDSVLNGYEIERFANEKDLKVVEELTALEVNVKSVFDKCIETNLLSMKFVDAFFRFDRSKIVFYFTSPDRVDFRQFVKDLAIEYKSRIELRQVGVRDEAKIVGGYGMCGCKLCCNSFLSEFSTIDTNMAKVQDLIINPEKISGVCGRLMCCLAYEKDFYIKEKRCYPGVGSSYSTEKGVGYVKSMNILTGIMLLQHEDGTYEEVKIEKDCSKTKYDSSKKGVKKPTHQVKYNGEERRKEKRDEKSDDKRAENIQDDDIAVENLIEERVVSDRKTNERNEKPFVKHNKNRDTRENKEVKDNHENRENIDNRDNKNRNNKNRNNRKPRGENAKAEYDKPQGNSRPNNPNHQKQNDENGNFVKNRDNSENGNRPKKHQKPFSKKEPKDLNKNSGDI